MGKDAVVTRNSSRKYLYLILAAGIILRLPNMNESIWFDELGYATSCLLKNLSLLWQTIIIDRVAPFYRIFMFIWIRIFGDSEISIRMPSLICSGLSIWLSYGLTLRFGGRKAAVLTAILLCLSPVHIWYAHEATPYSMLLFFLLSAIFAYYKLIGQTHPKPVWYVAYFCSLLFAALTHYSAFIYVVIIWAVTSFKTGGSARNVRRLTFATAVIFIIYAVLKFSIGEFATGAHYLRPFTFFELWMLFFNWFSFGNALWSLDPYKAGLKRALAMPGMLASQIFLFILFLYGIRACFKKSGESGAKDLLLFLFTLPAIMLALTVMRFNHTYIERGLFLVLPFFYMVLASGAVALKERRVRFMSIAALIIFAVAAFVVFMNKADEWTVYRPKPDWRSAASYFRDEIKSAPGPITVLATTPASELVYYGMWFDDQTRLVGQHIAFQKRFGMKEDSPASLRVYYLYFRDQDKGLYEKLLKARIRKFYVIRNVYWEGGFSGIFEDIMKDPGFRLLDNRSFRSLNIYAFEVASDKPLRSR